MHNLFENQDGPTHPPPQAPASVQGVCRRGGFPCRGAAGGHKLPVLLCRGGGGVRVRDTAPCCRRGRRTLAVPPSAGDRTSVGGHPACVRRVAGGCQQHRQHLGCHPTPSTCWLPFSSSGCSPFASAVGCWVPLGLGCCPTLRGCGAPSARCSIGPSTCHCCPNYPWCRSWYHITQCVTQCVTRCNPDLARVTCC